MAKDKKIKKTSNNSLGIRGYDYAEFYVGSAKMNAYWFAKAMGLDFKAYLGPETGVKDRTSYFLESPGGLRIVVTSIVEPSAYDVHSFVTKHGDGVKRWSLEVDSVKDAFDKAVAGDAVPIAKPRVSEDENGFVEEAAIRVYDDAEIVFINSDNYEGVFKPGYKEPFQNFRISREETNLKHIDHIVGNVYQNEMNKWADYLNNALDFETFIYFGPGDISTQYSALLSKVVRSKDSVIRNPINEPFKGAKLSQIEEYTNLYHGSGIQHIAIATTNIIQTVAALRENGVEFLEVPDAYYEELAKKDFGLTENIDDLHREGILCDVEGKGYLLQLFTKPVGDRPTFFFEIIQRRKGASGFGQGNFQALFESIEREQARRGNL